jgi:SAM-dependent methyltransferase
VSGQAIEFYCAQAHSLPLADETASRVICTEVLEHVDDPASVIKELNRVGKSGALYLFSVPDVLGETMFAKVAPENYFQAPNHVRVFERDAFARLIEQGGLEIISHTMTGFFWSIWWALYWGCKPDLSNPHHPVLDHWTKAWHTLVQSDTGRKLKHQLDEFMPKSQFIVARKPAAVSKHVKQKEG